MSKKKSRTTSGGEENVADAFVFTGFDEWTLKKSKSRKTLLVVGKREGKLCTLSKENLTLGSPLRFSQVNNIILKCPSIVSPLECYAI